MWLWLVGKLLCKETHLNFIFGIMHRHTNAPRHTNTIVVQLWIANKCKNNCKCKYKSKCNSHLVVVKADNGVPPFGLVFPAQKLFKSALPFLWFFRPNKTFWIAAIFERDNRKYRYFVIMMNYWYIFLANSVLHLLCLLSSVSFYLSNAKLQLNAMQAASTLKVHCKHCKRCPSICTFFSSIIYTFFLFQLNLTWNGFYTWFQSKISLLSPLIIGSKLTFISSSGRWLPTI